MRLRFHRHAVAAACILSLSCALAAQGDTDGRIKLRFGTFDPLEQRVAVPADLQASGLNLWIVQFDGLPTDAGRTAVTRAGGEIHGYLPENSYVVRTPGGDASAIARLPQVRWVGVYHPAYRLDPALIAALENGDAPTQRYNIVVVDKHNDKPTLIQSIRQLGGLIDHEQEGSILLEATLTPAQLRKVAALDQVLWVDAWTPAELDMDNARIQGGGNYVESQGGFTGVGLNAHIYEGIQASHYDFTGGATAVRSSATAADHGHATGGIVFGNGSSNSAVRGMAPDVGKFYTNYSSVSGSRYQVVSDLVNIHDVSHTTASWGGGRTLSYTSTSADSDDIIFDHDIAWTQSQSNAGNQQSRPQAWAKNIFSIGGVSHRNNSNPADDSWAAGGASTGPAADGRIKPTLCAYYDNIGTSDRTGSAGYSSGDWTGGFGGTSGATPIVAGHNVLAIEMFTDGIFGNQLRNPGGSRHSNRPKFTTLKALQVANAAQYSFTASSGDNRREHQGWGFPDLRRMWDYRAKTFIVDETDVLTQGNSTRWDIQVAAGEPDLKICMTHAEPAANPSASLTRINNLSLRVTAPNGTIYWGNNGLESGIWSASGGAEDTVNTIECVFVPNPTAGTWHVDVIASLVAQDSHVETPAVDADYGLVVSGGTGQGGNPVTIGTWEPYGSGCPGSNVSSGACGQLNGTGGALSNQTSRNEYAYTVSNSGSAFVQSVDFYTASASGSTSVGAYIYTDSGSGPSSAPAASTTVTVGSAPGFYTATFASPVAVNGTFYVALDHSGGNVYLSNLNSGSAGGAYWRRPPLSGTWSASGIVDTPSYRVNCVPVAAIPQIGNSGVPSIDNGFDVTLADANTNALALLFLGFSDTSWSGGALPTPLNGAPGCDLLVSPDDWQSIVTSATGSGSVTLNVPNVSSLVGISVFHQWLVSDPAANSLGVVASGAAETRIGG